MKVKCSKKYSIYTDCRTKHDFFPEREYEVSESLGKHLVSEKIAVAVKENKKAKKAPENKAK